MGPAMYNMIEISSFVFKLSPIVVLDCTMCILSLVQFVIFVIVDTPSSTEHYIVALPIGT
jgi:hypothetical protein